MTKNAPASTTWEQHFSRLFHAAVKKYQSGHEKAAGILDAEGKEFLASIGYSEQEFFDFVEDFARGGEPTLETALKIAEVRRDYFVNVQGSKLSRHTIDIAALPSKDAQVERIGWLPRIIPKAEAKLRGEMPADLMYGCGGDRRFFKDNHVDPAAFLRTVWTAKGNTKEVVAWVKAQRR